MASLTSGTTSEVEQPQATKIATDSLNLFEKHSCLEETKAIILALSSNESLNRRQISKITGIEIPSLCRALGELVYKYRVLIINNRARCPITQKMVMVFSINPNIKQEVKNG